MKQPTIEDLADRTTVAGVTLNGIEQLRVDVVTSATSGPHVDLRIFKRRATGIYLPSEQCIVLNAGLLDPLQQALRATREHLRGR